MRITMRFRQTMRLTMRSAMLICVACTALQASETWTRRGIDFVRGDACPQRPRPDIEAWATQQPRAWRPQLSDVCLRVDNGYRFEPSDSLPWETYEETHERYAWTRYRLPGGYLIDTQEAPLFLGTFVDDGSPQRSIEYGHWLDLDSTQLIDWDRERAIFCNRLEDVTWRILWDDDCGAEFMAGDANADGWQDIGDVIAILLYNFGGAEIPACPLAADVTGDRLGRIEDAILMLQWIFVGGPPPDLPWEECGDVQGCTDYPCGP